MTTEAFNLARRLSARNENDLVQQDMVIMDNPSSPYTQQVCMAKVKMINPTSPLPNECQKYEDVLLSLQRRDSDREAQHIAFLGMGGKEAAMNARSKGRLSQAQVTRRMTSRHGPHSQTSSWWA